MCIILVRSSSKDCKAIYILVFSLLEHRDDMTLKKIIMIKTRCISLIKQVPLIKGLLTCPQGAYRVRPVPSDVWKTLQSSSPLDAESAQDNSVINTLRTCI